MNTLCEDNLCQVLSYHVSEGNRAIASVCKKWRELYWEKLSVNRNINLNMLSGRAGKKYNKMYTNFLVRLTKNFKGNIDSITLTNFKQFSKYHYNLKELIGMLPKFHIKTLKICLSHTYADNYRIPDVLQKFDEIYIYTDSYDCVYKLPNIFPNFPQKLILDRTIVNGDRNNKIKVVDLTLCVDSLKNACYNLKNSVNILDMKILKTIIIDVKPNFKFSSFYFEECLRELDKVLATKIKSQIGYHHSISQNVVTVYVPTYIPLHSTDNLCYFYTSLIKYRHFEQPKIESVKCLKTSHNVLHI